MQHAGAKQEIDYGRRGSGYVFGAFQPASGAVVTRPYERRTTANWVDFLSDVEAWIDPAVERVYAALVHGGRRGQISRWFVDHQAARTDCGRARLSIRLR